MWISSKKNRGRTLSETTRQLSGCPCMIVLIVVLIRKLRGSCRLSSLKPSNSCSPCEKCSCSLDTIVFIAESVLRRGKPTADTSTSMPRKTSSNTFPKTRKGPSRLFVAAFKEPLTGSESMSTCQSAVTERRTTTATSPHVVCAWSSSR